MTDHKYTDEEVIRALELCADKGIKCDQCQYTGEVACMTTLCGDALDLINRLKAQNEKWQVLALKQEDTAQMLAEERQKYYDEIIRQKDVIRKLSEALQTERDKIAIMKRSEELDKIPKWT